MSYGYHGKNWLVFDGCDTGSGFISIHTVTVGNEFRLAIKKIIFMANTQTTTTSKQFTISLPDVWKGLLVAVITPVITIIMTSLNAGTLTFDWKAIGITALAAGVAYLVKNFLTPSAIMIKNPVLAEEVKAGDSEVNVISK